MTKQEALDTLYDYAWKYLHLADLDWEKEYTDAVRKAYEILKKEIMGVKNNGN